MGNNLDIPKPFITFVITKRKNSMKVIKINSEKNEVIEINITPDIKSIYQTIGNNCRLITPISLKDNNVIYVDETILYRKEDIKGCFQMKNVKPTIAGNALVIGVNDDGEWIDTTYTVEDIKNEMRFVPM